MAARTRLRPCLFAAAALALAWAPHAAACSFITSPPDPGRIYGWDLDAAELVWTLDVWQRDLDGDCGLMVPHDLYGDRVAWRDRSQGGLHAVYLGRPATNEVPAMMYRSEHRIEGVDLEDGLLIVEEARPDLVYDDGSVRRVARLVVVGLADGTPWPVEGGPEAHVQTFLDGGRWMWTPRTEDHRPTTLSLYDARTDSWVFDRTPFAEFAPFTHARLADGSRDWLAFQELAPESRVWLLHLPALEWLDVSERPRNAEWTTGSAADGDLVYVNRYEGGIVALARADGQEVGRWGGAPMPWFRDTVVEEGIVTLGRYSLSDNEWGGAPRVPPDWLLQGDEWPEHRWVPGLGWLTSLAGVAGVAGGSRWGTTLRVPPRARSA